MGAQWSRVVNTTIAKFIRQEEVNILRNRKTTALMKKRGRITFNHSGTEVDWKIRYKRAPLTPFADGDGQDFARKDRWKTAKLGWRGYSTGDTMTKGEFLQNRSTEAIIKVYSQLSENLMEDMEDAFGEEIWINGNLAANEKRVHGIESFMSATANPGNGAATPTGSFAGLSCVPGAVGGTWNSGSLPGWPNGKGDAHYDYWSPLVVDYTDTLFPGTTWAANCEEAISFLIIKGQKSKSAKGALDMILLDDELYRGYLKVIRGKERVIAEGTELQKLGFKDSINQDGCDISWEYGMTPGVGYGLNVDQMELRSQQAQVFVPEGPDWDIASKSWRFSVDFFGNLVWNPKFQAKLVDL